jgi:hypothetical protein
VLAIPRWPKIIVSKRGASWIVIDSQLPQRELLGESLITCNGENVDDLARKKLGGFRADWSVGAQQIQAAPWLLGR